jgi:hypothetical protein
VEEWLEEQAMLNKERFFKFGLDLHLEEVEEPENLYASWANVPVLARSRTKKGFAEENLETVLSVSLNALIRIGCGYMFE